MLASNLASGARVFKQKRRRFAMRNISGILMIIFLGCAPGYPVIFEPTSTPEVATIYSNGIPLASSSVDSLSFLLSLDQMSPYGGDYFRLWAQCENLSESPMLLDPSKAFVLIAVPKQTSEVKQEFKMEPESAEIVRNKFDDVGISSDLLRKNTLSKNQSVSGYVYFRQNMHVYSKSGYSVHNCDPEEFDYRVMVQLPGGNRTIEFKIARGE
jgi:hypothetical protein